ncbi:MULTISPECIES: stage II sporulation protein P [Mesobacillus]|uniref:Stage II sporulation protein P n=2 Tax=Mesobacillus TaxID=2675231 RepID=A0A0D6ZAK9_9BACI|nr:MULTISPECIES: stage II sporulation protein P [Mesobacillus]KIY22086.1 stage II sporulation protein P [Mesobacillus subterraneus]MDQ0414439.1 stage II sporulation protein P [Mesobacillus stamsii]
MRITNRSGIIVAVHGTQVVKAALAFVFFLIGIFSISGAMTTLRPELRISSDSVHQAATNLSGELLFSLMGSENHQFLQSLPEEYEAPRLTNVLFTLTTNINLDDPRSLLGRELPGFPLFDGKILVAGEGTNYTNMPMESAPPFEVLKAEQEAALQNTEDFQDASQGEAGDPPISTGDRKAVYIYFTHTRESYLPYLKGITDPNQAYHSKVNVTRIGDQLKADLEQRGIGTTVDKTDVMENLSKKGLGFGKAYQEARPVVEAAMTGDRNLQYFIDIHRDGYRKDKTTIQINGKSYAKLAFIIGGENANYEKNLQLARELHNLLNEKYGKGLSRGVIEKKGASTNGKFNQDLSGNALLIEFGGVDNTFEELNRSADALADVFSEFYWQAEKVEAPAILPPDKK